MEMTQVFNNNDWLMVWYICMMECYPEIKDNIAIGNFMNRAQKNFNFSNSEFIHKERNNYLISLTYSIWKEKEKGMDQYKPREILGLSAELKVPELK